MRALVLSLLRWSLSGPFWHFCTAYVLGYFVFITVAIILWGFVYRPAAKLGRTHPVERGEPWTSEELIQYALLQGVAWPFMLPIYACFLIIKSVIALFIVTVALLLTSGSFLSTNLSKVIPDKRPRGFQVKL